MRTKIKYCGLKRVSEIELACQLNVDAIGLVFVEKSPRFVSIDQAKTLTHHLECFDSNHKPQIVALFVNPEVTFVNQVIKEVKPDVLQFHGTESAQFCQQFGHKYWKAIAMLNNNSWQQNINAYQHAEYCLLDAFQSGELGGSGHSFDWFEFPVESRSQLILAGGLNLENVKQAIEQTKAEYVDVSSGIESSRGVKSHALMKQFLQLVNPS